MKNNALSRPAATVALLVGAFLITGCSTEAIVDPTTSVSADTPRETPSVSPEPTPSSTYQAPVTSVKEWQSVTTDNNTATFQAPEDWDITVTTELVVGHDGADWYQNFSDIETGKPWSVHYYDGPFNDVDPCLPADMWEIVSSHSIDSILGDPQFTIPEEDRRLTQHQVARWVEQDGDTWAARIALVAASEAGCQPVAGVSDGIRNVQFEMTRTLEGVSTNNSPYFEFPTREEAVQFLVSDDAEVVVATISSVRFSAAPADAAP